MNCLTVIKILVDSLVLSRINYVLPAWGPSLSGSIIQHVQRLLNWGIRITASLRKFAHVSAHRTRFRWLPVTSLVTSLTVHYQKFADVHSLLYALLEFVFPTNFDSFFNRHSHLYHKCTIYRGWVGGRGMGRVAAKKN